MCNHCLSQGEDVGSQATLSNDEELFRLIEDSLAAASIGLYPSVSRDGSDFHTCPFCNTRSNVVGQIFGPARLDQGSHQANCSGLKLLAAVEARRERLRQAAIEAAVMQHYRR